MERKRDELVSTGAAFNVLVGKVKEALQPSPQGAYHFTRFDQVDQLVGASESDADLGFMARLMTLCSLPRTDPGNRKEYVRHNGPYTLGISAGINNNLPFGNIPPPVARLDLHRSRTYPRPRASPGVFTLRVYA